MYILYLCTQLGNEFLVTFYTPRNSNASVVTMEDVKSATKKFGIKKWQDLWEKSERGRALYIHRPEVNLPGQNVKEAPSRKH